MSLMGPMSSLHDVQVRLLAWLDGHYHVVPHAGLLGCTPNETLYEALPNAERVTPSEELLREALTIRQTRRVRTDGTLEIAGREFELELPRRP